MTSSILEKVFPRYPPSPATGWTEIKLEGAPGRHVFTFSQGLSVPRRLRLHPVGGSLPFTKVSTWFDHQSTRHSQNCAHKSEE